MEAFHRDLLSVEGDPTLRRSPASASSGSTLADDCPLLTVESAAQAQDC